ncbi:MAG TPA: putative LPS assembly protein LptD [Gemmatimonadaceae bacterium]
MRRIIACIVFSVAAATAMQAQVVPRLPGASRGIQRVQRDSADTTGFKWPAPDSITQELMQRPDYTITRYQGDTAFFNQQRHSLDLLAAKKRLAVVQRDSQTIVSDSGIYYSEATRKVQTGGNYILSDPSSGQADIRGSKSAEYNLAERSAAVSNARFAVNNGEMWYLSTDRAKILIDSTGAKESVLYARGGSMTSCPDSIPDYHFEYKEAKRAGANTLVARPAILYIRDVPVMWLPFIFSDTRSGRHSGILPPLFGLSDIVRNSPNYRRNVEHVGYYWAPNDYMDASVWLDWRSKSGGNDLDPGWLRYNGTWGYKWINRFLAGNVGVGYTTQADNTNLAVTWAHSQDFSANSHFNVSANYVTSTQMQRQNTLNPYTALATIGSQASYQTKLGPASLTLGATRTQYPGRQQVDQTLPSLSLTSTSIGIGSWFAWTPSFSYSRSENLDVDQPGLGAFIYRPSSTGSGIDSVLAKGRDAINTTMTFDTPIQLFGRDFKNTIRIRQQRNNMPTRVDINDFQTGEFKESRIFGAVYKSEIDWSPDLTLPPIARNIFNFSPSVRFDNVDPNPYWVASQFTNGKYVHQTKRVAVGVSAAPTLFGRFPGFGPFSALRHTIAPTIGYSWAPAKTVSDEYLLALGQTRAHYLGGLRQNAINFGLSQNFEAKVRAKGDTLPTSTGQVIKLLSINTTPIQYDFERMRASTTHSRLAGFSSSMWGYNVSSDLLPGFDFSSQYSLFQGDVMSDTAKFSPYLTGISASFRFGRDENPLVVLTRLFGKAVPDAQATPVPSVSGVRTPEDEAQRQMVASQPVAGDVRGGNRFVVPPAQGWRAGFTFSRSSPRPPSGGVGANIIDFDPRVRCEQIAGGNPFVLQTCLDKQLAQPTTDTPIQSLTSGGPSYRIPATTSLNGDIAFNLTPKWAATWQTTYDFELHQFASHIVSLQRDLHDWRAIFGFTQSPNGNFAFHFTIALKAEPDLKFDYNKATVRSGFAPF